MQSPAIRFSKGASTSNPIPRGEVFYIPFYNPSCWGITFQTIDPYGFIATRTDGVMNDSGATLDGDDFFIIPDHAAIDAMLVGNKFSLVYTITPATVTGGDAVRPLFTKYEGTDNQRQVSFYQVNNTIACVFATLAGIIVTYTSAAILAAGTKSHIVMSVDKTAVAMNDKVSLYHNGAIVDMTTADVAFPTISAATSNLYIGQNGTSASNNFDGIIKECSAHNVTLSASEAEYAYRGSL
uniref:Putative lectin/glucanase superfamily protein n=1 Tax=viral metagenome TaxID=1070528 RepID=A0A6M3K3U6_9ZZZZ